MSRTDEDNPTKGKISTKKEKGKGKAKEKSKEKFREKAKEEGKAEMKRKTSKKAEEKGKAKTKAKKKETRKEMKPKTFKVSGSFLMGADRQKFQKEVTALGEKRAREKIFQDLGSKHRVKRSRVLISSVEEVA